MRPATTRPPPGHLGSGRHVVELDRAHGHESVLAGIGCEHALAEAEPAVAAGIDPLGLARQADRAVVAGLRTRVARRHQGDGLAAIREHERRRHPDAIAQVLRRIELDARKARERHPVVAAVDARLEHRAETGIGVGDPGEGLAIDLARHFGRGVEGARRDRRPSRRCPALCSSDSISRASHSSGWPKTIGVRFPAKTLARISSQRIAWPTVSRIATVSASMSATTLSCVCARSHWPSTQSNCDRKMRSFASAGLARTALVRCCRAALGSPARSASSASDRASGMACRDVAEE